MKLIDFDDLDLAGDNRKRPLDETARVELQIYIHVPASDLRKLSGPGRKLCAADVVQDRIAECDSVGEVLRKLDRYTDGAVIRVSGR